MCMRQQSQPCSATSAAIPGSWRNAVTSLTYVAPASIAARATSTFIVSTLSCAPASLSAAITGTTRLRSSSAGTGSENGRVDSPPTSRIVAPSPASSRPWAIAASRSNHSPPSENESGVTLTMPMIRKAGATPGIVGARRVRPPPVPAGSGGARLRRQPLDERGAREAPLVADPAPGQPALLGEREHRALVDLEQLGGLRGREDVGQVGGPEGVVADDELRLVGLDHDAARQRAGRLGAEAAQRVEAAVGVGVDVAGDEARDEVLLRSAHRLGGAVELARLVGGEADVQSA